MRFVLVLIISLNPNQQTTPNPVATVTLPKSYATVKLCEEAAAKTLVYGPTAAMRGGVPPSPVRKFLCVPEAVDPSV